ncbi:MAG TPA: PA2778 family cysteine peptidase [Pseudomonadales bacterium]|nr:PA2778 family cysteine peptidase [Pseudomonadales bacterium]
MSPFIFSILLLPGCALFRPADLPPLLAPDQAQKIQLPVPFFAQSEHQCGPAATAMLLRYTGLEVTPESLSDSVYSQNKEGSLQPSIVASIRRNGRIAYEINDWSGLLAELNAGRPVLVLENLALDFWPVWHYAVVVGYDSDADEIILHSGTTANERVNARRFAFRWLRGSLWGIVALKPDDWPANAEEERYLQAVLGFERLNPAQAVTAYQNATKHWPASAKAWLGYGNAALNQKNYGVAADSFQKATLLLPNSSGAWNNLALSYFYLGRKQEAREAIKIALKLAPENPAILDSAKEIGQDYRGK